MLLQSLKMLLAPPIWQGISSSWKIDTFKSSDIDVDGPCIFASLHRDILPALVYLKTARPYLLVSHSPDGDILVKSLGDTHYRYVRGCTGADGGKAVVKLRRHLEDGKSIGLAVDGPEGPYGTIHDGVFLLAKLTGAPILPLTVRAKKAKIFNTWDKTVVPHLFSEIEICRGPLLYLADDVVAEEIVLARQSLTKFFGVLGAKNAGC